MEQIDWWGIIIQGFSQFIQVFFNQVLPAFWQVDEFKAAIVGMFTTAISYRLVGNIMLAGKNNDIWFGRIGGKILFYIVNSTVIWLIIKLIDIINVIN
ncbi:hypothetical protein QTL86_09020 [Cellulosilyticum sp. ST5]|uniref:hypothetical protein n=1 Tax=Cellulosilyticum sp. ST5 TaxID=3055805 RepID=UPI0039774CA2